MNSCKMFGGVLYYGIDECGPPVVDGKPIVYPRWLGGLSAKGLGLYRLRRRTRWEKRGNLARFAVATFSHKWFARGAGLFASWKDHAKRGGAVRGDTHTKYDGLFAQIGFWWFKFYLYIYVNGDGL